MGFSLGQRVADYEVVSILGSGGMGRVYQVRNVISHRIEAMKVLFPDLNEEPDLAARFRSEIRTLAGLHHPNIAQLHTALQNGNELLMIMEFVEGSTLHQLAQAAPLSPERVADYIQQALAALSYAHSRGVIHRDIKPANIMVTSQGAVKLTDFGIAKSKAKDELTRPGTTLGSLNYMSPEQALGSCMADERSDIYSVGITLYELLTGQLPFDDESAYVVLHRQLNELPRPPIEINPLLPQSLNDLIMKALEKNAAHRFQTAAEFSERLREITGIGASKPVVNVPVVSLAMSPVRAGSAHIPRTAALRSVRRRRPWLTGTAAAAGLAFVGFAAVGMAHFPKNSAMAKTVSHAVTQPPSSLPAPAAKATSVVSSSAFLPPAAVSVPRKLEVIAASALSAAPTTALKLSRAAYHPTIPAKSISKQESDGAESERGVAESDVKPVLSAATLAQVQGVRRQKEALDARASVLKTKMARLRNQQMLDGHDVNQGMADAYVNMNMALAAEDQDLQSGNLDAAHGHMETAAAQVSVLEKLFNQ